MPITKTFDGVPIQFVDEISAAAMTREVGRLQQVIDAAAKAKKKDDDDDADEEMEREKKERGYQDAKALRRRAMLDAPCAAEGRGGRRGCQTNLSFCRSVVAKSSAGAARSRLALSQRG